MRHPKEAVCRSVDGFSQDQTVTRYATFDDLRGYCVNSANPVGRLVLYVCGYRDEERQRLSDYTCTALQLANFWQDVTVDYAKDRIYLPLEDLRAFSVTEQQIAGATMHAGVHRLDEVRSAARAGMVRSRTSRWQENWIRNLPSISNCSPGAGRRYSTPSKLKDMTC